MGPVAHEGRGAPGTALRGPPDTIRRVREVCGAGCGSRPLAWGARRPQAAPVGRYDPLHLRSSPKPAMNRIRSLATALGLYVLSAASWAQSRSSSDAFDPTPVSEPGTIPLVALAVAGAVGVARYLKNRKK